MSRGITTAKLRHDISRGRAGDKVDALDPAAAPLGTDDEAAGTPPAPPAIAKAYAQEITQASVSSEAKPDVSVAFYFAVIGLLAGLIIITALVY